MEGQVATVDTTPWTYDGSAVITLATPSGNVDVLNIGFEQPAQIDDLKAAVGRELAARG